MKVPSNLMPFLYQNGGILARCGIQTSSYLRAKLVLEVNNCGSCGGRYPNEGIVLSITVICLRGTLGLEFPNESSKQIDANFVPKRQNFSQMWYPDVNLCAS